MDLNAWQSLTPCAAADRFFQRLAAMPEAAARSALAWVSDRDALEGSFAESRGPLHGVPVAVKDLFDLAGVPTRAGSTFLPSVRPTPTRDSALVGVLRQAGGVVAAKTHLHEFAYGLSGENPHYGSVPHPSFPGRLTGGSSSGSAWAVAAGLVPMALGTDTGGSIRVPAAFCGLFGLRWATGSWGSEGVVPLSPAYDASGWFTHTGSDMIETMEALAGPLPGTRPLRGQGWFCSHLDLPPTVQDTYARQFARWGLREDAALAQNFSEAFADSGWAYGVLNSREAFRWHQPWLDTHRQAYDPSVWNLIDRGRGWSPGDIERAEAAQARVRAAWAAYFREWDYLVLPAVHDLAPRPRDVGPDYRRLLLALNTPASLGQLPVLCVPLPLPGGGSVGFQVVFRPDHPGDAAAWLRTHT